MLRLGKLTDYAIAVMAQLARRDSCLSASQLAQVCGLPEPTVAKILKTLLKAGLAQSTRGAAGGYALKRPASQISVSDIVTAFEGPVALTACLEEKGGCCNLENSCSVRGSLARVNAGIRDALGALSLAEVAGHQPPAYADSATDSVGAAVMMAEPRP